MAVGTGTLTFADLQGKFLRWIDEGSDTSTTLQLAKDSINGAHRRFLTSRIWPFMKWPVPEQFTTQIGIQVYPLTNACQKLLYLYDTVRLLYVPLIPRREWPAAGVNLSGQTQTMAYGATLGSTWPVKVQPVTVQTLSIVSSSGQDAQNITAGVGVQVQGRDGSGNFVFETILANGNTPVNSVNQYTYITSFSLIQTWAGTCTLSASSTGTLDTFSASQPGRWYPTIELTEKPNDSRILTYSFQRQPKELVNDYDIPDVPAPWSEILVYDALLDLTTYNTELGQKEQELWKSRYDYLFNSLTDAYKEEMVGSYPRVVRDVDAPGPSPTVWNYNATP